MAAASRPDELYRLSLSAEIPEDAWRTRLQWTSCYKGVAGLDDHFLHLSSADQVEGTAAAYFAGKADVMLLRFSSAVMREEADLDIRWEAASTRDGDFPHVYGGYIPFACLTAPPVVLALGPDGKHILPSLGPLSAAATEDKTADDDGADDCIERGMDDEDGYDGCAATGMYG